MSADVGRPAKKQPNPGVAGPIARNLRRLMAERGLTSQHELAALTGDEVAQEDVSRILRGKTSSPTASKLRALATALGVTMEEFWAGESPQLGADADASWREFEGSSMASGMTDQEKATLRRVILPLGPKIDMAVWAQALTLLRMTKGG